MEDWSFGVWLGQSSTFSRRETKDEVLSATVPPVDDACGGFYVIAQCAAGSHNASIPLNPGSGS